MHAAGAGIGVMHPGVASPYLKYYKIPRRTSVPVFPGITEGEEISDDKPIEIKVKK